MKAKRITWFAEACDPWPTTCRAITFPSVPGPSPTTREPDRHPRPGRGRRVTAGIAVLGILAAACASPKPPAETGPAPQQRTVRPLAALATQAVALVPAQYLRAPDSTLGVGSLGPTAQVLASLDSAIAAELTSRGAARSWVTAEALARSARRNPAYTSDPHALSAESLRHGVRRTNARLGEPLASQMRSLVALTEARFALIPVELRFEAIPQGSAGAGATRAILRVVVVDARLAEVQWTGDVMANVEPPSMRVEIVANLARHLVDLIAAP